MLTRNPQGPQLLQDSRALLNQVLADENTAEIARNLGFSTEEYVDQVVHFLLSPSQEPWLYVIEDEDLRSLRLDPPDREEMGRFVIEAARLAEAAEGRLEILLPLTETRISKSPFSKLLVNVGLSAVTGGANGLLSQGLGTLRKQGGGALLRTFKSFSSQFLTPVQGMLSSPGLWGIASFLGCTSNSNQLLSMARVLFSIRQKAPPPDEGTAFVVQHNLLQLFAHHQAQLVG
ncbi:MAG TPA: hypothetical protein VNA24_05260 [Hyalangium sp.]|nr:hypothetical protein [Hyalangium sp.]